MSADGDPAKFLDFFSKIVFSLCKYLFHASQSISDNRKQPHKRSRFPCINIQLDTNIARGNYATLAGGCYTMILGERYSIPPGGIVLKDRLQLGNMWRSDHLSRKRTRRVLRRGTTTHLALTCDSSLRRFSLCEMRWTVYA